MDLFYLIVGAGFVLSLLVQAWLKMTYSRWSRVRNSRNVTGSTVARHLLDQNDLWQVSVQRGAGRLTDHYDPRSKSVTLSEAIYREPSVASAAIAAHECGHAIQDRDQYGPMRLRQWSLPLAQLGSQYGPYAVVGGWLFGSPPMVQLGFLMFAGALIVQFINLPVEFDASRRARDQLKAVGLDSPEDQRGTRKVLRAAAMTYVAGAATAAAQLLFVLFIAGRGLLGSPNRTP